MQKTEICGIIDQAYQQNKMFESILFEGNNQNKLEELVAEVSRFLYCQNHQFSNDDCSNCQHFIKHQTLDYYEIGDGFLAINKETLKDILNQLEQSSQQFDQPKILVIKNAENLKIDAANALLKFLEEPTNKTFLFLLTRNKNSVLPTIKSRTKILTLDLEDNLEAENFLTKVLLTNNQQTILLLNNKLKKMELMELIGLVEQSLPFFLKNKNLHLYQHSLELINDLKFDANTNLAIDRFLIKVCEVE